MNFGFALTVLGKFCDMTNNVTTSTRRILSCLKSEVMLPAES